MSGLAIDAADVEAELIKTMPQKGTWQFTDTKIIEAKREKIMQALGQREGITLNKKGALYWNDDKSFRAVCTVSKRYAAAPHPTGMDTPPSGENFYPRAKNLSWCSDVSIVTSPTQFLPPSSKR